VDDKRIRDNIRRARERLGLTDAGGQAGE